MFGVFCQYSIVTIAQTQKINVFWIAQSSAYLELLLFYHSDDFWRFRGYFCEKTWLQKLTILGHGAGHLQLMISGSENLKISHLEKSVIFEPYFIFLIGLTHTNNFSMVLLACLLKKFSCDMHTLWATAYLKTTVCS